MDHSHATLIDDSGPISQDWTSAPHISYRHSDAAVPSRPAVDSLVPFDPGATLDEVLHLLSDDARQHDPALRHPLLAIEQALTGRPWHDTPSTIALIRSIADVARCTPAARSATLAELIG